MYFHAAICVNGPDAGDSTKWQTEEGIMNNLRQTTGTMLAFCVAIVFMQPVWAQLGLDRPKPGAVVLKNGLILRGLCSTTNTIDPLTINQSQGIELRMVDQRFRNYVVSIRKSDPVAVDNRAVPNVEFRVQQRRVSRRPLNYAIGLHNQSEFDAEGKAVIELRLAGGEKAEIEVGITAVNAQYATVDGLTHNWEYAISTSQIPDATLYNGVDQPGLLKLTAEFKDGEQRLNMVKMLIEAEKFTAAKLLIGDIAVAFPELSDRCDGLAEAWNDAVGQRVLDELAVFRDSGKHQAARRYARAWPEDQLAPSIRVRAQTFVDDMDSDSLRVSNIRQALNDLIAKIEDEQIRKEATGVAMEIQRHLNPDSLARFAPFELFSFDDGLSAESRIAMAATGWLLGPDNAFDNFPEAAGLLQIRYAVSDFLQTEDDEVDERNRLLERIRAQEGFSVKRVARLIEFLPPCSPLNVRRDSLKAQEFSLDATSEMAGCMGQLPGEYNESRQYPMLIAFSRGGADSAATLQWWSKHADRNGYVLVVPSLYEATADNYDATAMQHAQLVALIRKLKACVSVNDNKVFIAGHGLGGEVAMDFGTAHPDLFAGIISLGGLGRKHVQWTAHNATTLPWYVVVGTRQPFYYSRMEILVRKLFQRCIETREYCDVLFARYAERGFEAFSEELPNVFQWMSLQNRVALPAELEATVLRSTDMDWFWLGVNEIPSRFASMDGPSTPEMTPGASAKISAAVSRNVIRVNSIPGDGFIRLSPELPGIDIEKPITVRVGGSLTKISFDPSIRDLLEDYRIYRDRSRLAFMKVAIQK